MQRKKNWSDLILRRDCGSLLQSGKLTGEVIYTERIQNEIVSLMMKSYGYFNQDCLSIKIVNYETQETMGLGGLSRVLF